MSLSAPVALGLSLSVSFSLSLSLCVSVRPSLLTLQMDKLNQPVESVINPLLPSADLLHPTVLLYVVVFCPAGLCDHKVG